jgi:hypothetical protein
MPKAGVPSGKCTVCAHFERGRIDFLAASGSPLNPLAEQFGLSKDSLHRHFKSHVTETYKRQVRIGPLQSEDSLRKLAAEQGVSVFEHLQGLRALFTARLMIAYEAGADSAVASMGGRLIQLAELMARLSKELMPPSHETNNYQVVVNMYDSLERDMLDYARTHPEAHPHFVAFFRSRVQQQLIDVSPERAHVAA